MKNKMRKRYVIYLVLGVIFTFVLALSIGTVRISPVQVIQMLRYDLGTVREVPEEAVRTIFFQIRLPRVLLAFCVGCALSVSGVLMQSVLKNSLASSYTLGVSSGAALGASLAILGNFTFFGTFTLSFCGMSAGIVTVILAVVVAQKLDHSMENTTIILTGMAFSLFANAMISFIISIAGESVQQIIFWQMGSFALKNWTHLFWIFPVTFLGILLSLFFHGKWML